MYGSFKLAQLTCAHVIDETSWENIILELTCISLLKTLAMEKSRGCEGVLAAVTDRPWNPANLTNQSRFLANRKSKTGVPDFSEVPNNGWPSSWSFGSSSAFHLMLPSLHLVGHGKEAGHDMWEAWMDHTLASSTYTFM